MNQSSIIFLILIILLSSGCMVDSFGDVNKIDTNFEETETNLTGNEILEKSVKEVRNLDSYHSSSNVETSLGLLIGSRTELNVSSKLSEEKEKSRSGASGNYTMEFPVVGPHQGDFKTETILTSKAGYKKSKGSEESGEWNEIDHVFGTDPFILDSNSLENSDAELKGEENIRGAETYALSLSGGSGSLADSLARRFEDIDQSYVVAPRSFEAREDEGDSVTRSEIFVWVDKESFIPVKISHYLAVGAGEKEKRKINPVISARSETFYTDFNKSADIEVPEALDEIND